MEAARAELRRNEAFRSCAPTCPAASFVGQTPRGAGAVCAIEESVLAEGDNPQGLAKFCFGQYQTCPTWRTQKAWEEAQRSKNVVPQLSRMSLARPDRPSLQDLDPDENIFTPRRG